MPKRLLALVLLAIGLIGVYPYMPQVKALFLGHVDMPSTDLAKFSLVSSTNTGQLITCQAGGPITMKASDTQTWPAFKCWSNYPQDLSVTFSLATANTYLQSVSGVPVTVKATDLSTAQCRNVTFTSTGSIGNNGTAYIRAHFQTTDQKFAGDIYFPLTVSNKNGNGGTGYTCN